MHCLALFPATLFPILTCSLSWTPACAGVTLFFAFPALFPLNRACSILLAGIHSVPFPPSSGFFLSALLCFFFCFKPSASTSLADRYYRRFSVSGVSRPQNTKVLIKDRCEAVFFPKKIPQEFSIILPVKLSFRQPIPVHTEVHPGIARAALLRPSDKIAFHRLNL